MGKLINMENRRFFQFIICAIFTASFLCAAPAFAQKRSAALLNALAKKVERAWYIHSPVQNMRNLRAASVAIRAGGEALPGTPLDMWSLDRIMMNGRMPGLSPELKMQVQTLVKSIQNNMTQEQSDRFLAFYPFLMKDTPWAIQNNKNVLELLPVYQKQLEYIDQNRKEIINALDITDRPQAGFYAQVIPADKRLILLGEVHHRPLILEEIKKVLREYHAKHPKRKIVFFSEFLPDYRLGAVEHAPIPVISFRKGYTLDVLKGAEVLGGNVYGLESAKFLRALDSKKTPDELYTFLCTFSRNKEWAKIIREVMARVRVTDPDAVFFVHAGSAHTDRAQIGTLGRMFSTKESFVINFSDSFNQSFLGELLEEEFLTAAPVPRTEVLRWAMGKEGYAQRIGFDIQVLLPQSTRPRVMEWWPDEEYGD